MCKCKNVEMGSYSNSTVLKTFWKYSTGKYKLCNIDNCLLDEIKKLWKMKIKTLECCCGHNITEGYIAVYPEHIEQMKEMGYELESDREEDIFYPQSIN